MATEVTVLADSINTFNGCRLTTFKLKYPRIIHSEFMTHRMIARNAKSSRAMSIDNMMDEVLNDPFIPKRWPSASRTMHNTEWLDDYYSGLATQDWKGAIKYALDCAELLAHRNVHKQIVNRLLEPFMWIEVIASATSWDNFFNLRCSNLAQPEFAELANMMKDAFNASKPEEVSTHNPGPYKMENDVTWYSDKVKEYYLSNCGALARVSYGKEGKSFDEDLALGKRLLESNHMSPFEHMALPVESEPNYPYDSCIKGWITVRRLIEHKDGPFAE